MSRDRSVPEDVTDEEVEFVIRRLHEYKSAMGDPDHDIANLIRVLEILYGVTYDDFSDDDIETIHHVISEIDEESTQRLSPSFVQDAKLDGYEVLNDIDERVSNDGFDHVPLIGQKSSQ